MTISEMDRARFEANVDRSAGPDGCHLFTGYTHHGYGRAWAGSRKEWAHRAAWKMAFGDIPEGAEVAHRCDVRNCVNPSHLWLATHAENMRDMHTKRRHKHGGNASKLSERQVLDIRSQRERGVPIKDVAAAFGVSQAQVSRIANGTRWAHVGSQGASQASSGQVSG